MKQPPITTIIITLCFICPFLLRAQQLPSNVSENNDVIHHESASSSDPEEHLTCGTEVHHEHLMRTDAMYRQSFLHYIQQLDSVLNSIPTDRNALPPQYTIPVVVHVIHL